MTTFKPIPGATPLDADGLIADIRNQAELNAAEAESILKARRLHLSRRHHPHRLWCTEAFLRKVHQDMFGRIWSWAGRFRQKELNLGTSPHRIIEEIQKLCQDVSFWDRQEEN